MMPFSTKVYSFVAPFQFLINKDPPLELYHKNGKK